MSVDAPRAVSDDALRAMGVDAPRAVSDDALCAVGGEELYVYGLVEPGAIGSGVTLGDGVAAAPVRLLRGGGGLDAPLDALVSAVAPGPVAQTRRNMLAHTAVLERLMGEASILPMRFGTVAPAPAALARCIAANAAPLRQALSGIVGRVELGVRASWRDRVVYDEIITADAALRHLRDRLRNRPAGETYYERVELGRRVEAALAERRAVEAAAIVAALAGLAEQDVELRTPDEDTVLNRAFLVRRDREAEFDARMQVIAERCGKRMDLRYVGPIPPYNFVRVQAGWLGAAPAGSRDMAAA